MTTKSLNLAVRAAWNSVSAYSGASVGLSNDRYLQEVVQLRPSLMLVCMPALPPPCPLQAGSSLAGVLPCPPLVGKEGLAQDCLGQAWLQPIQLLSYGVKHIHFHHVKDQWLSIAADRKGADAPGHRCRVVGSISILDCLRKTFLVCYINTKRQKHETDRQTQKNSSKAATEEISCTKAILMDPRASNIPPQPPLKGRWPFLERARGQLPEGGHRGLVPKPAHAATAQERGRAARRAGP